MNIWIFNNYSMLPEHGPMSRTYNFIKQLNKMGHKAIGFGGSHPHNTELQLIPERKSFAEWTEADVPWVYIKTCCYKGSRVKQVFSMLQYYCNSFKAAKYFFKRDGRPDAIIGSSGPVVDLLLGIKLARKYKCKAIIEVRDLWPESLVAYNIAKAGSLIVRLLRRYEKWCYKKADEIIFTMEGAYDYIVDQGWENEIPREKVHLINNGIDLESFEYNKEHYQIHDEDLNNPELFKVVYTGSVRKVNNIGLLLDAAKEVKNPDIKILIWGAGNELGDLQQRVSDEKIENVVFKGRVEKKYIPYIVSHADINIAHNNPSPLFKYGISFNKIFDYLAADKPILCDFPCKYNPVIEKKTGVEVINPTEDNVAKALEQMAGLSPEETRELYKDTLNVARKYDFSNLARELVEIVES